MFFEEIQDTFS